MYGPATSLALLANLNDKLCVGFLGVIGTFYTTIGGLRGVIWNDLFQALVMVTSLTVIITKGVYDVGGLSNLWEINRLGGRLNFFNFDPDPLIRQSFWTLVFGQIIYMSMSFAFDQQMIQRFQVRKSPSLIINMIILIFERNERHREREKSDVERSSSTHLEHSSWSHCAHS